MLSCQNGGLDMTVEEARIFGLRLPRWLCPVSDAREFARDGRFHFDFSLSLPVFGLLVRYNGWLVPDCEAVEPRPLPVL
jgi:hypothetical protein